MIWLHLLSLLAAMKMILVGLLMTSIPLLRTNGGKDLSILFHLFLHIPSHGRGDNGAEKKNCNDSVTLFVQNMIIHVCVLVDLEHYMRGLRLLTYYLLLVSFKFIQIMFFRVSFLKWRNLFFIRYYFIILNLYIYFY